MGDVDLVTAGGCLMKASWHTKGGRGGDVVTREDDSTASVVHLSHLIRNVAVTEG